MNVTDLCLARERVICVALPQPLGHDAGIVLRSVTGSGETDGAKK